MSVKTTIETTVAPHNHNADSPVAMPTFRCALEDGVLGLVPSEARAALPPSAALLRWNPACWIQHASDAPSGLADRTVADGRLWSHLSSTGREEWPRSLHITPPLAWIEHSVSRVLQPLWLDCTNTHEAERPCGEPSHLIDEMSSQNRERLTLSGVLVSVETLLSPCARLSYIRANAAQLKLRGFVTLHDIISPVEVGALRRHFRALRHAGFFQVDKHQVIGMRDGLYCEQACMFFQRQLAPFVGELTGEQVKPSYTWVRRYRPGAELRRHRDRPQCKWNVSLCVDTDPECGREHAWPLYIEVNGQAHRIGLGMGDAVLYSGSELTHWRERLDADRSVTMCLFHYVPYNFAGPLT
jgi:hypothetical protein